MTESWSFCHVCGINLMIVLSPPQECIPQMNHFRIQFIDLLCSLADCRMYAGPWNTCMLEVFLIERIAHCVLRLFVQCN